MYIPFNFIVQLVLPVEKSQALKFDLSESCCCTLDWGLLI